MTTHQLLYQKPYKDKIKASYATNIKCHLKSKLALFAAGVNILNTVKTPTSPKACAFQIIFELTTPLLSAFSSIIIAFAPPPPPPLPMDLFPFDHPNALANLNAQLRNRYNPNN
mmetsp:Transcript_37855/g.79267  ORF Transcript_37855/g.79267 Transcript_37855/m.79267 type:complete len:114 (-) Transcript_37855:1206-1547(-)